MRETKYDRALAIVLQKPFFTNQEAFNAGIPRHVLAYLVKKGMLERIRPGIYRPSQYQPQVDFLMGTACCSCCKYSGSCHLSCFRLMLL